MSSTQRQVGFTPAYHLAGGLLRGREYRITGGEATAIFDGDMVKLAGTGTIQVAAANERLLGMFAGCSFTKADGEIVYSKTWPAGQAIQSGTFATAYVYDDPFIVYRAFFDAATGVADIGQLTDLVNTAGSTLTGRSKQELNATTGTGTAQFRVLDFVDTPGNAPGDTFAEAYVQIFEHEFAEHSQATPGV